MKEISGLEEFKEDHPWPDKLGIDSLYKFYKFDEIHPEYISHLLVEGKLYHSLPKQLNDPWECKPHWTLPKSSSNIKNIRDYLIKLAVRKGDSRKNAQSIVSKEMRKPNFIKNTIYDSIQNNFGEVRVCSFTSERTNPLLWSHYANSHRGICVEFDSTKIPINMAYRVKYQSKYPTIDYPLPTDQRIFIPVLTKGKEWSYEHEFRTIFVPEAEPQPSNDGESLILSRDVIKSVYFGAQIKLEYKCRITDMIESGPFSPKLWNASLSQNSYKMRFNEVEK